MSPGLEQLSKEQLAERVEQAESKFEQAQFDLLLVKEELAKLKRMIFGKKSERYVPADKNQLELSLGEDLKANTEEEPKSETITYNRRKKKDREEKPVRTALPSHLRREIRTIQPEGDLTDAKWIRDEFVEWLEEKPSEVYVVREVHPVYVFPGNPDKGVKVAASQERPLQKFNIGVGMLALIYTRKYVDHLPVYRQIQIYKRQGLNLAPSTVHGWIKAGADLLVPLYEKMLDLLLARNYIQSDDTRFKVMEEKGDRETLLGYMWVYQDPTTGMVVFQYTPNRNKSGPDSILENFKGYLQCDGLAHYTGFEKRGNVIVLNCWAHARRKFVEAKDNNPEMADDVLREIQKLYEVERIARENKYTPDQRLQLRQEKSLPVLKRLKAWLTEKYPIATPQSSMGKAIFYTLSRFDNLSYYCNDGILEIDNNLAENSIRPIVLGRKNYLFAATHESAQRAAVIYSLVTSCKRNNVNPEEYLADVLARIQNHPNLSIEELLPQNWKKQPVAAQ